MPTIRATKNPSAGKTILTSRRNLLRGLGMSVAATAATHSLRDICLATSFAPQPADGLSGPIRLDRNENPYGPAKRVKEAMQEGFEKVNRFPALELETLVAHVADRHSVGPEQVVLGCGSTEILRMCAMAFLGPGQNLVMATPGFDVMAHYAQAAASRVQAVPLNNYEHDLQAMARRCNAATGLIYICNPNNPTGSLITQKEIQNFLAMLPAKVRIVIDEAYHDYVKPSPAYASFIESAAGDARVIVTRTFSKIHGLAGLRIGYAIAANSTARRIATFGLPEGVNVAAAQAASIALQEQAHVRASALRNADQRQEFFNQANARMLRWVDSHTNFILLNAGRSGNDAAEHFRKNNIRVMSGIPSMKDYVRVSLGTPEQMKEFWRVWDLMPVHSMHM